MASNNRKNLSIVPLIVMLVITLIAAGAAVYCFTTISSTGAALKQELREQQAAAIETNEALYDQYQDDMAVYDAELAARGSSSTNTAWPTPKGEGWEIVDLTNYPLESAYTVTMTRQETMYNGMLLVNEWHSRPDDFSELSLVSVSGFTGRKVEVKNSSIKLFPEAAQAVWDLVNAAKEAGLENYVIYDAYRSWDDQNTIFQDAMAKLRKAHPNYSDERLIDLTRREVNYPGTSSYNGGQTFRVILYKSGDSTVNNKIFFECDEGQYFLEHAWEYGIVFRFQLADYPVKGATDKGYKTGVSSKLQTFSYVGRGNAAVMNTMDMCMEEYIEYLGQHPHIAVFENGVLRYEIVRQYVGEDEAFQVQMVGTRRVKNTTTSLDNMGYVITVFEY